MAGQQNPFVWYELVTTDQEAAEAFYAAVVGWSMTDAGMPSMRYTILNAGKQPVGGIMAMADQPPGWLPYLGTQDVDAAADAVTARGGAIHRAPQDIPGVGRFAVVADPQGAPYVLFRGDEASMIPPPDMSALGQVGWHELHTSDLDGAWSFYSGLYGWSVQQDMDMGPAGIYRIFRPAGGADDAPGVGALFRNPDVPHPQWLLYFRVDDIAAGKDRIEAGGGIIMMGPIEVPGGQWIVMARDPQGGPFALLAPK